MRLDDFKQIIRLIETVLETVLLVAVYYFVCRRHYQSPSLQAYFVDKDKWELIAVYALGILTIFQLNDGFRFGYLKFTAAFASQAVASFVVDLLAFFQLCLLTKSMLSPVPMIGVFLLDVLISGLCCYIYTAIYHKLYVPHDMLLVYGSESGLDLKFKMDRRNDQYTISEVISVDCDREAIRNAIARHDAVIINDIAGIKRNDILKYCYTEGIRTYLVPKISDIIIEGGEDITLFDTPLKLVKGNGLTLLQRFVKRGTDILFCLIALVPGIPLMLVTALAIHLEDRGPVFYRQKRVTRNGKVFSILKFRSMVVDAEKGGYNLTMRANERDPRITKVGRIIRALRLDEIPQVFNILKGDMSFVGPRPERVENVQAYAQSIPEWHLREKVKGGLTGYAQVYGRYNTSPMDKVKLDVMYIENYSIFLDIKLIIMTLRILFTKESTEGFDVPDGNVAKREELIRELEQNHPHVDEQASRPMNDGAA